MKKIVSVILVCILMVGIILSVTSCTGSVIKDGTYALGYRNYAVFEGENVYFWYDEVEIVCSYKVTEERFFIEFEELILIDEDFEEEFEEDKDSIEEEIEEELIDELDGKKIRITNTGFQIGKESFIKMK